MNCETNSLLGPAARAEAVPYGGQRWLVEERDACGVGFVADRQGRASFKVLQQSLKALSCMEHRGGCSADRDSGDGAGIMSAIPWAIFQDWARQEGRELPASDACGVGMVFFPQDATEAEKARTCMQTALEGEGLQVLGWRSVPTRPEVLGEQARENLPRIEQVIVSSETLSGDALERELYVARSRARSRILEQGLLGQPEEFYVCSFSTRTIVYKGMVRSAILSEFYLDLQNPAYETAFAVYHRRFSTNTMPKWPLAQPMRLLGHNGEINTHLGNINWMRAREKDLAAPCWQPEELEALKPFVDRDRSDSANLDSVMELLVRSGRAPMAALMILVPEAYQNQPDLVDYPEIVDFYEYYSGMQESWDGPALLVFSDGKTVGASLDRNGLRPARYSITSDDLIVVASETGVVDLDESTILEKGRLGPGQSMVVDLSTQEILRNWEIKERIAKSHPYGEWLRNERQIVGHKDFSETPQATWANLIQAQTAFGFTAEDVEMVVQPMAIQGKEPTFCMGDDIPLAVLSEKPRLLYDYFKQRFAQVTNPAIDPLRESLVMSLQMTLTGKGNVLEANAQRARLLKIETPLLNEAELAQVKASGFTTAELSTLFAVVDGPSGLEKAVDRLCAKAEAAVRDGAAIVVLSDRAGGTVNEELTYIPPLLAVGAVHHHLIRLGLRMRASLVVDTAQCWSTHHYACLIGFGASAVCPYLTLETIRRWWADDRTQNMIANGKLERFSCQDALKRYRQAIEAGILKILSKMGISLLSSYHGAQIFEAIGLGPTLVERAFRGTTSRLGGLSLEELASEVNHFHSRAYPTFAGKKLENLGFFNNKAGGEYHMNSPAMSRALHKAVRDKSYDHYQLYKQHLEERPATALRDLLDFKSDRAAIPVAEVESIESIVKRFCTGAMSLGSLSQEAHETLAIAMNRIGGKSNSGEGGEDPARHQVVCDADSAGHSETFPHLNGLQNGDTANSATKQVASGRFGVTPEYLMSGRQIEIKVSQGAKPGEGGQLPGPKVSPYIAMLRRSKPGVSLISPPPHHDIYSIEDLAQLIFDLHQVNPAARVSVKLVAEIGIGTVAAGVAKGNADVIQISGHDGGTGASPLSSIKHAGVPWELGVTEVHRVLMENGLRDRVLLRADGGLKTGWDVLMAALMGAEEYGFGSVAMIAEGCIMARVCHTNNCPVGVATQQERLRKRFPGTPEQVVNFFYFVAEEVRSLLAHMGYCSLKDLIGRADLLQPRVDAKVAKTSGLILDCLVNLPDTRSDRSWLEHGPVHTNGEVLDDRILATAEVEAAIQSQGSARTEWAIVNTDRCVGARVAGKIAKQYGDRGFAGEVILEFEGSAGQSFGAFNLAGMTLKLSGDANDYVGKGMNGGEIIVVPSTAATFDAAENAIIGNTCLYGATGGTLYANGRAGERFAVRNSVGKAVILGAGDHCCEYMTGGIVVVLGKVGRNVGAGMTGGIGYFLDEENTFPDRVNPEIVKIQRVVTTAGEQQLKELVAAHAERTASAKSKAILANWDNYLGKFWQVVPPSEADTPEASAEPSAEEKVLASAS
ncbi:MAG: glutamate synthase large subunit [Cyanobacteria bacterium J06641_5]